MIALKTLLSGLIDESKLPDISITSIVNDSRLVEKGSLFIAYPGYTVDGRNFIQAAIASGASAVLYDVEGSVSLPLSPCPQIGMKGVQDILPELANRFYQNPSKILSITGITGTNGKTTVAYLLSKAWNLLHKKSSYLGTLGHGVPGKLVPLQNTTPEALLLQKLLHQDVMEGVQQVSMEVSSHALSLGRTDGVQFHQAIYTNLSHDHLDFHKTMTDYAKAKSKLFECASLKAIIINQDCPYHGGMIKNKPSSAQCFTYSVNSSADFQLLDSHIDLYGMELTLKTPSGPLCFKSPLVGQFNIYNLLSVVASLYAEGITLEQMSIIMPQLKAPPGRLEVIANRPVVVVDYAHTPDALLNVLSTLAPLKKKRLIVMFGCGGDRDKQKRPLMAEVAAKFADEIIITSDNPRHEVPGDIIKDIIQGIPQNKTYTVIEDRANAIKDVLRLAEENDLILIAGKGHENYQQIGEVKYPFSDQAHVQFHLGSKFSIR